MSYQVFQINNKQDAIAYMVKRSVNSIESDLTICKMNMADILEKCDSVLDVKENRAALTEDQVIYLEALRSSYRKLMDVSDSVQKGI